jgi:hypothetical protein
MNSADAKVSVDMQGRYQVRLLCNLTTRMICASRQWLYRVVLTRKNGKLCLLPDGRCATVLVGERRSFFWNRSLTVINEEDALITVWLLRLQHLRYLYCINPVYSWSRCRMSSSDSNRLNIAQNQVHPHSSVQV